MKKTLAILLALALVLCMMPSAAFATGETGTPIEKADGDTVVFEVDPIAEQTYCGEALEPTVVVKAVVKDAGNNTKSTITLVKDTDYTASYSNNTNKGVATVTITGMSGTDSAALSKSVTFTIKPFSFAEKKITFRVDNQVTPGTSDPAISFDSLVSNNSIHYYVDGKEDNSIKSFMETKANGKLSGNTVSFGGSDQANFNNETISYTFSTAENINSAIVVDANGKTITSSETLDGGTYNGQTRNVSSMFTLYKGSVAFANKIDPVNYTITIKKNGVAVSTVKDAGTYTIEVTGREAYGGMKPITLTVAQKDATSDYNVRVDTITEKYVAGKWTGLEPVVRDTTLGVLTRGVDYTMDTPVSTGTQGTVLLRFQGNYTGTKSVPFSVVDSTYDIETQVATTTLSSTTAYMYNGKVQTPSVVAKKADGTVFSSSYYTVSYEYTDSKGKVVATTSPVDAHVYSVYLVGRNPYAGKKYVATYTIPQFSFSNVDITATQGTYANSPNVVVRALYDNITFVKDKDYTVSSAWVSTSTNKGYVTVTSTGTGNLAAGSKSITYSLVAKSISYCTTEFATGSKSTYQYTGSAIMPKVKVRDSYTVLTEGTDYSITYKDASGKTVTPRDAGTYTIEITGKGAYTGTTRMTFTIVGLDISGYTVTLKESSVKADGYSKTPTIVSVKNGFYTTLSSADYTVSYEDASGKTVYSMSTPGTYKVIVTGKNGYSGSTYATFRIVGNPQEIKIAKTSYKVYKDSESFKITATATGDGTGFSYVSSNPAVATVSATGVVTIHKIGRAKITVTTTGMKKSEAASDDVYVKVYPDKTKITQKPQTEGNKGSFRVRWEKQDDVTYYEVRYARNSAFKSGTYLTKKVNASTLNYTTQSTKISNLKSGARYYVKVRAVKVVYNDYGQEQKYYGTWSNWRSVVTK